uniref:Helicase ATP-binding domain-containing protein n=1 Tax=Haptolina ericina TaxID=156174 RepID=A0A7S3ANW5_9EUKA
MAVGATLAESDADAPPGDGVHGAGAAPEVPGQRLVAGTRTARICEPLWQVLKPMQVDGVHWLFAAVHGGGGILADDPGLGKTLQLIALLEALVSAGLEHRVLIVTPSNLLANWSSEFRKWLGGTPHELNVSLLKRAAAQLSIVDRLALLVRTRAPRHDITLLSYEGLERHGRYLCAGAGVDLLIADEAHALGHTGVRQRALRAVPALRAAGRRGAHTRSCRGRWFVCSVPLKRTHARALLVSRDRTDRQYVS